MAQQESRRHHYVPQFLLKRWAIDNNMHGYYWHEHRKELACDYTKGEKAFGYERDLLSYEGRLLQPNEEIKNRDEVEKEFSTIDDKGDKAIKRLLKDGPESLSKEEKCDFAKFLLSLITRIPGVIDERNHCYSGNIDNDPKALCLAAKIDPSKTPSEHYAQAGYSVKNHAIRDTRNFTDRKRVIDTLINLPWHVVRLGEGDGTFVLADRPLVRGTCGSMMTGFLPLTPKAAFVADERPDAVYKKSPQEIARSFNIASCAHAKKYVFCTDDRHKALLREYLTLSPAKRRDAVERRLFSAGIG